MILIFLLIFWLAPVIPAGITMLAYPERFQEINTLIPMLTGSTAYTWLMLQFLVTSRPKWLERHAGLDRMFRMHGLFALSVLLFGFVHRSYMLQQFSASIKTLLGLSGLLLLTALSSLAIVFMADMLVRRFQALATLRQRLSCMAPFAYQVQLSIHGLNFLAALILFIHVMLSSSTRYSLSVRLAYIGLFLVALGSVVWKKGIRPARQKRNPYRVTANTLEGEGIWTLQLMPTTTAHIRFAPGQFGFSRFFQGNLPGEEHPFSFSSAEKEEGSLTISIKGLGDFTRKLKHVKPGDLVSVDGPYGRFTPARDTKGKLVLVAGGIGITPMLSVLDHLRLHEPDRPVLLIWGLNEPAELIRRDFFETLAISMPNLHFAPVFRRNAGDGQETGFVDREKLIRLTAHYGFGDLAPTDFSSGIGLEHPALKNEEKQIHWYLCGPGPMLSSLRKALRGMRIPARYIHDERFSL